jgi:histidinol-phosphate aminotransferase
MKFNETLENIKTYEPGLPIEEVVRQYGIDANDIIKLASNENPFGCSKKASEAVAKNAHMMFRYPDDTMGELKTKLANKYGVSNENLIIGSGSDQVIEFLIHAKAKRKILTSEVTFAMYAIYAATKGVEVVKTKGLNHDLQQMYALYKEHNPEIIFICTPNNPTGDATKKEELYDFLEKIDENTLVVIDGAYGEYAAYKDVAYKIDAKELTQRFKNTIYLATFSKAYGLGGMRVGYGIADKQIIDALYKLRPPFNVTTLSLIGASYALDDEAFVDFCIEKNFEYMKAYEIFAKKHNIEFIESFTNFITYKFDKIDSSEISHELLKKGIIVRNLKSYNLNAIRITIGTQEQNERFFAQLEKLLGS